MHTSTNDGGIDAGRETRWPEAERSAAGGGDARGDGRGRTAGVTVA